MLLAVESLHLAVGPPRLMGSGAHRSMAIKAFLPVFKSIDGVAPAKLQGFLVCTIMLDGFFDSFLGNAVTGPDLSVRVYDGETAIFSRGVWHGAVEPSALAFGDRNWRVEFSGQGQPIESELWLPLLVFAIGLALTALLYLRLLRADTEYLRIADEVRLATAELASANHRLAERSTALQQVADDFRRSSQEAQVANAAKTVFLANMSHELRTPLNAVIGFSEMIANQALGANSPRYIDYAKDIRASGRYLLSIIEDLLDMSRIELGQMQLRFEPASLADLTGEVVKFVALRARERGIDIRHSGMESLPQVEIDPKAMRQALINLLTNAVKFSDPGSGVEIRGAIDDGGGIAISVIDHGSGIREQDLGRIFEPFWQSEAYRSKSKDGIGLGLAITQRLVTAHDATIEVNSQVGVGTTMTIHLPAARVLRGAPRLSVVGGTRGSAG
jgi:signal transduction histidine kinase